jgi:hypothetical protein
MALFYAPATVDSDGYTSPEGEIPPSVRSLRLDEGASRFVLLAGESAVPIPESWSERSEAEVEADYPGLLGGE